MSKRNLTLFTLILTAVVALMSDAEAKRFGGGRSFGGRALYSTPYKRSQLPLRPGLTRQQALQRKAQAARQNQKTRQSWRQRGGLIGWLAPLLIGGLLGSLLFGGAFEHLNLADFLVFGALAFLAFKLLSRRPQPAAESPYPPAGETGFATESESSPGRPFDTDLLFGQRDRTTDPSDLPEDFDPDGFLERAKTLFRELQEAWNRGEIAEIRGLTTDEVFMEIKDQWQSEGSGPPTRVLALDAQLLDYRRTETGEEATVLFTAELQEGEAPAETIQEVWHFVRPGHRANAAWLLDGIQQVED